MIFERGRYVHVGWLELCNTGLRCSALINAKHVSCNLSHEPIVMPARFKGGEKRGEQL